MDNLERIKETIRPELDQFNKYYKESLYSSTPLLNKILKYTLQNKGKQIRPMFVLLSAKIFGEINENTYRAAIFIELLHAATLIHDDVVDGSMKRRGVFSVNALWKNKVAVLTGDYLLSKGMIIALENKEYQMLDLISETVKVMSESEILQIDKARLMDITEDEYFNIIKNKTASIISSCCAIGALSVNADNEYINKMKKFGLSVGIAFQIRDDIFDYQPDNKTGKPSGNDIKEHKMTLPLIYLLNNSSPFEKRNIIRKIKHHGEKREVKDEIIEKIKQKHGFDYAENKMRFYIQDALNQLDNIIESDVLFSLKELVSYCVNREK